MIKIFHTGDFHLDSPFSGVGVRESDARRAHLRDAFSAMLERAVADGCRMVLIAGDLFDCGYVTTETVNIAFGAIEKCAIPVVIAPGNHDPYEVGGIYDKHSRPENLFVFSSEKLSRFDFDELGVSVHGYAFTSERMDESPLSSPAELSEKNINILLAHGDIYSPISKYAPIAPSSIETSGFDYVALGHVHKAEPPVKMGRSTVAYCGFPEGRGFDELGFGGALEVSIGDTVSVERVVLSTRRYLIEELDVTGASGDTELTSAISSFISKRGYGKETSLRIILRGAVSPELSTSPTLSAEGLGVSLIEIEDDTSPVYDAGFLKYDVTLRGALYRQLLPELNSHDSRSRRVAKEALKIGLAALDGKQIF